MNLKKSTDFHDLGGNQSKVAVPGLIQPGQPRSTCANPSMVARCAADRRVSASNCSRSRNATSAPHRIAQLFKWKMKTNTCNIIHNTQYIIHTYWLTHWSRNAVFICVHGVYTHTRLVRQLMRRLGRLSWQSREYMFICNMYALSVA